MADYAGAKAAIKARLVDNWLTTPITVQNEAPSDPWPPLDADAVLLPWINLEVAGTGSDIIGQGSPGNQVWLYTGWIYIHVFVPVNTGIEQADTLAVAAGELFRRKTFYDDVSPGCYIRTWAPSVDGGGISDDDGNWFRVTASIDFEYWHRG
jgi:hypothetical protein